MWKNSKRKARRAFKETLTYYKDKLERAIQKASIRECSRLLIVLSTNLYGSTEVYPEYQEELAKLLKLTEVADDRIKDASIKEQSLDDGIILDLAEIWQLLDELVNKL